MPVTRTPAAAWRLRLPLAAVAGVLAFLSGCTGSHHAATHQGVASGVARGRSFHRRPWGSPRTPGQ
jgi:hypothetical protein